MEDDQRLSNIVLCPRSGVLVLATAPWCLLRGCHLPWAGLCPRPYSSRESPRSNAQGSAAVKTGLVREG